MLYPIPKSFNLSLTIIPTVLVSQKLSPKSILAQSVVTQFTYLKAQKINLTVEIGANRVGN